MRLLLSCHGAALYGGERVLLTLAGGLAARGHEIVLEIPHAGPALDVARSLPGVEVWLSGRVRLPRNASELLRWSAGLPAARRVLERPLRDGGFDALWVSSIYNAAAAWAGAGAGVPVLWHLHERAFRGLAGAPLARAVAAWSTVPVAVSAYVTGSFEAHACLRGRVRVLPNPLLAAAARHAPAPLPGGAAFVVGCVGQLEPRKRVEDVVAGIAAVPDVRALIVGDGKGRGRVTRAIEQWGVSARVELTGFVADPAPLYERMSCVVIPSVREPFGLVALEAMAAGRPVIAARSGALPEVLGDAALFYDPGDSAALADCVRRLQSDPDSARRLRDLGLARVRDFDREQWLTAAEALAEAAIGAHGGDMMRSAPRAIGVEVRA